MIITVDRMDEMDIIISSTTSMVILLANNLEIWRGVACRMVNIKISTVVRDTEVRSLVIKCKTSMVISRIREARDKTIMGLEIKCMTIMETYLDRDPRTLVNRVVKMAINLVATVTTCME